MGLPDLQNKRMPKPRISMNNVEGGEARMGTACATFVELFLSLHRVSVRQTANRQICHSGDRSGIPAVNR